MRRIKEVLRLKYELGLGQRQIARSCSIGQATVNDYLRRADFPYICVNTRRSNKAAQKSPKLLVRRRKAAIPAIQFLYGRSKKIDSGNR
jgi:hypothetical protein